MKKTLIASLVLLSACATVTDGYQSINIKTFPEGADCVVSKNGVKIKEFISPALVRVPLEGNAPLNIDCEMAGYKPLHATNEQTYTNSDGRDMLLTGAFGIVGGMVSDDISKNHTGQFYYWDNTSYKMIPLGNTRH